MGNALIFRGTNAPKIFDTAALWRLFEQEQAVFFYAFTDVREAFYPRGSSKPMAHSTAKCNGRQKTGIHNTAKSGRRNGQPVE
jgi:hypothetical protein